MEGLIGKKVGMTQHTVVVCLEADAYSLLLHLCFFPWFVLRFLSFHDSDIDGRDESRCLRGLASRLEAGCPVSPPAEKPRSRYEKRPWRLSGTHERFCSLPDASGGSDPFLTVSRTRTLLGVSTQFSKKGRGGQGGKFKKQWGTAQRPRRLACANPRAGRD